MHRSRCAETSDELGTKTLNSDTRRTTHSRKRPEACGKKQGEKQLEETPADYLTTRNLRVFPDIALPCVGLLGSVKSTTYIAPRAWIANLASPPER